jgi:sarcosine oxidase, subunit gamma
VPKLIVAEAPIVVAWNVQGEPKGLNLEISLPTRPNTIAERGSTLSLWLGPRSWLLLMQDAGGGFAAARDAVNAQGGALFDVSASRVAFTVRGVDAAQVLAKSCPLDFNARAFPAGTCAQSLFGRVNALYYRLDEAPAFTLLIARSFAREAWRRLRASAAALS